MILFVTHNIITRDASPEGYLLLCCIWSYLYLNMYASFEVHTEETIVAGHLELETFSLHMQAWISNSSSLIYASSLE